MSKSEIESTVTKLIIVTFIFYICMYHIVAGGGDVDNQTLDPKVNVVHQR